MEGVNKVDAHPKRQDNNKLLGLFLLHLKSEEYTQESQLSSLHRIFGYRDYLAEARASRAPRPKFSADRRQADRLTGQVKSVTDNFHLLLQNNRHFCWLHVLEFPLAN